MLKAHYVHHSRQSIAELNVIILDYLLVLKCQVRPFPLCIRTYPQSRPFPLCVFGPIPSPAGSLSTGACPDSTTNPRCPYLVFVYDLQRE